MEDRIYMKKVTINGKIFYITTNIDFKDKMIIRYRIGGNIPYAKNGKHLPHYQEIAPFFHKKYTSKNLAFKKAINHQFITPLFYLKSC